MIEKLLTNHNRGIYTEFVISVCGRTSYNVSKQVTAMLNGELQNFEVLKNKTKAATGSTPWQVRCCTVESQILNASRKSMVQTLMK